MPHFLAWPHAFLLEEGSWREAYIWVPAGLPRRLLHLHRTPVSTWGEPIEPQTVSNPNGEWGLSTEWSALTDLRGGSETVKLICEELLQWKQNRDRKLQKSLCVPYRNCYRTIRRNRCSGSHHSRPKFSCWLSSNSDQTEKLAGKCLCEVQQMWRGTKSGHTESVYKEQTSRWGEKGKRRNYKLIMSCYAWTCPFSISSPSCHTFSTHTRALPLWLRCQRKTPSLYLLCRSSSFSPSQSFSFSPVFFKCCFFKVSQLWNSASLLFSLVGQPVSCGGKHLMSDELAMFALFCVCVCVFQ